MTEEPAGETPPLRDLSSNLAPEEARALAQAIDQLNDQVQPLLERLRRGEPLSPQELERLARMVDLNQVDHPDRSAAGWQAG